MAEDSLQEAFEKFRLKKKKVLKQIRKYKEVNINRTLEEKALLRQKFINQAKKYIGVPYSQKPHSPESEEYNSPLFLDCCALVRQVLLDLRDEFGFCIGPWNQAYQYDTLPNLIKKEDLKPGDLVFISGIYVNKKSKVHSHNMVHVEIWVGEGEKTIGSRWKDGKVEIHDSFQFTAKSYHSMTYHFKSIDTWLNGICRSHCVEHPWTITKYADHNKHSIFAQSQDECDGEDSKQIYTSVQSPSNQNNFNDEPPVVKEKAKKLSIFAYGGKFFIGGNNGVAIIENHLLSFGLTRSKNHRDFFLKWVEIKNQINYATFLPGQQIVNHIPGIGCLTTKTGLLETLRDYDKFMKGKVTKSSHCVEHPWTITKYADHNKHSIFAQSQDECDGEDSKQIYTSVQSPSNQNNFNDEPPVVKEKAKKLSIFAYGGKFFIGGNNGVAIIENHLLSFGLTRSKNHRDFFLKWVEIKNQINYATFLPGQQIVNHIPGIGCLTTKTGLLETLRDYDKFMKGKVTKSREKALKVGDFFSETYFLNEEKSKFVKAFRSGDIWIYKPSGRNQGKGIFLVDQTNGLLKDNTKQKDFKKQREGIIQRYIMNPLLINGYKFDVRVYMLIACSQPYLVYYHHGYVRLSCVPYSNDTLDIHAHLTNQYVQKKHPSYSEKKEDTVLSFDQLNDYINTHVQKEKKLQTDWVYNVFTPTMKEIMLLCFHASKNKIQQTQGMFELLGFDFMVDENMKVWLIEVNINPALHTNCKVLKEVIPGVVNETLDIVLEVFQKKKSRGKLDVLQSVKNFESIYNGLTGFQFKKEDSVS
ncbi:protein polyglycylase TTLL10-like [Hydractinia symbiolongicarpus]|uniref:protein polyglycylase TTLL10-like n=1 Tax=Hydractinia symbiolongicarpus TaxID=13093 RepID=UPI00254DEBC0|nr:protein polyglycylase TTLL10-like [Hydractinia symbiolongicarpus]